MALRTCTLILCISFIGCHKSTDSPPEPTPIWTETFPATDRGAFLCAWGRSEQEIWVVGGQPDSGYALRYDGDTWRDVELPPGPLLNWVHGSETTTWMVGNGGRILRLDGTEWRVVDSPVDLPLWGVWAANDNEAFAVGGDPIASGDPDPVLLHYREGQWSRVEFPELDRSPRALFKVWGTSSTNVYAVGARGVILHYDGKNWTQQFAGTARDLVSLWGNGPDNILVAGGRANGLLARFDGDNWTSQVLDREPGMNGVWMNTAGEAKVVGIQGRILTVESDGYEYTRDDSENRELLHGVWRTPEGRYIAVGGTLDRSPPWTGISVQFISDP